MPTPREKHQFGRANGTRRKDDFSIGARELSAPVDAKLDACSPVILKDHAVNQAIGQDLKVAAIRCRLQVAICCGATPAIPCKGLIGPRAFLTRTIEIGRIGNPGFLARTNEHTSERVRRHRGNALRAFSPMKLSTKSVIPL